MNGLIDLATQYPLLIVAVGAILLATAGWMLERDHPARSTLLRRLGYLGLIAVLLLQVGISAMEAERSDAALDLGSRPTLSVKGNETIVPMASDGHFWVEAEVNGKVHEFLIDTGASFTGMSRAAANDVGIKPASDVMPLELETANGTIQATIGRAQTLSFGGITVQDLEVAVPKQGLDKTNVIGMNLLSQLASWRVEGNKLILTPKR